MRVTQMNQTTEGKTSTEMIPKVWKVPFFSLVLGHEEKQAAVDVIESNWLTSGPKIAEFERDFSAAMGGQTHSIAVANCTVALHLALAGLNIGPGDEVICPALSFVATANSIRYAGATPVFCDVSSETDWNIDPNDIERKITPKTKTIMVMHYGGYPCRMEQILEIAKKYNLKIIEDACHGPLAEWQGRKLGTIGDIGCFSFFGNKNMTTGEGGMLTVADRDTAARIRVMRSHGMTTSSFDRYKGHAFDYDVVELGFNYRMDEIRAAIGVEQLKKLPAVNKQRASLVAAYREMLAPLQPELSIPFSGINGTVGYHIFPVLLPEKANRRAIMGLMADQGIQTSIHYRPIHTFQIYASPKTNLPVTERIAGRILTLPLYPSLDPEKLTLVTDSLKQALAQSTAGSLHA